MFKSLEAEEEKAKEQKPFTELLYRIRRWNADWDNYPASNVRPPNITDFIEQLSKEFEVKKRV